jgi:hypothetical protein
MIIKFAKKMKSCDIYVYVYSLKLYNEIIKINIQIYFYY